MVYSAYSLESPHRGDSNENIQHTFMLQKIKEILIMSPDLALSSTLIGSNYPCLELIFMVPKVFEPLKFDCICSQHLKIYDIQSMSILMPTKMTHIFFKHLLEELFNAIAFRKTKLVYNFGLTECNS